MRRRGKIVLSSLLFAIGPMALACAESSNNRSANNLKIASIHVQLFYAKTGTLSANIAAPANFTAWNTIIGAGDAAEPATDFIVSVQLVSKTDELNSSIPLKISVRKADGKILAQRNVKSIFVKGGQSVQALFVPDSTCAGHVVVEAQLGNQKETTSADLMCGE